MWYAPSPSCPKTSYSQLKIGLQMFCFVFDLRLSRTIGSPWGTWRIFIVYDSVFRSESISMSLVGPLLTHSLPYSLPPSLSYSLPLSLCQKSSNYGQMQLNFHKTSPMDILAIFLVFLGLSLISLLSPQLWKIFSQEITVSSVALLNLIN